MKVKFSNGERINTISGDGFVVPFLQDNYGFFIEKGNESHSILLNAQAGSKGEGDKFLGCFEALMFSLWYEEVHGTEQDHLRIHIRIENHGKDFTDRIGFHVGVDTVMKSYPQWHDTFFPTLLRCEKSHLWGYYMNTAENALAIATEGPVASYDFQYNKVADHVTGDEHCGHRILGTDILFYQNTVLPKRHPQDLKVMKSGEVYENTIYLIPVKEKAKIKEAISEAAKVPMVDAETYTKAMGEKLQVKVFGEDEGARTTLVYPDGTVVEDITADTVTAFTQKGLYTLTVKNTNGKECEANFFVRKDWDYYLKAAAENALSKPPKATTHTESFYGLFSAFLYAKHSHDTEYLKKAEAAFLESMQYMFDMEQCVPLVIPERIQNISAFISLLVDLYEAAPSENLHYLEKASKFAEQLLQVQDDSGAYRCNKTHYTCVIYVAKSMLELVLAERECSIAELQQKAEIHFDSAKRAVDELVRNLDNIETEGEMTLEDGMISCSALQIAMFALMLPEAERKPYIEAAEYMMKLHSCLEQQLIPDCRCNGASLRYWEAQYDVMIRANMINSPHGWTGWTGYAKYYLYLLTGKKEYLLSLMNLIGSCMQLIDEKDKLRWAYCSQPYVRGMGFVPDFEKEVADGYQFVNSEEKAYRGKYAEQEYGEQYIDMISGWYRTGEQKVTGGYEFCPLICTDGTMDWEADRQGGCCDNDVHEVFKCMEETVLGKAFVHEEEDGSIITVGCSARIQDGIVQIELETDVEILVVHTIHKFVVKEISQNIQVLHV